MRALLIKNDAWGYVSSEVVKPEPTANNTAEVRDWNIKDEKAKSDLNLSIGAGQLKLVKNCTTSRELWLKLENTFQSKWPARKVTLLKSLTLKRMSEGNDVREHLHDFLDTVDKLSEMDVLISPDQLAVIMLYSLPSTFENFRVAVENRDDLPDPETLRTKIIEESDARKNTATSSQSQDAMFVNKRRQNERTVRLKRRTEGKRNRVNISASNVIERGIKPPNAHPKRQRTRNPACHSYRRKVHLIRAKLRTVLIRIDGASTADAPPISVRTSTCSPKQMRQNQAS